MNKRFVMGTLSAVLLAGTVPVCEAGAVEEPSGSQVAEFSELSDDINPGNTEEVVPTQEPLETPEPEPTEEPQPTEAPQPTESPDPTEAPQPTESPAPTEAPYPTEAPAPTETPPQEECALHLTGVRAIRTADNQVVLLYQADGEGKVCISAVREGQQPVFDFESTARPVETGDNQQSVNVPADAACEIYLLVQDQNGNRMTEAVKLSLAAARKVHAAVHTEPADATVAVRNELGQEIKGSRGIYALYKGEKYTITVSKDGYETKTETITADTKTTQYRISLTGNDAELKHLYVSSSDTYGKGILKLDPALKKDHDRYSATYDGERQSLNLWLESASGATVKVYALSGIKASTVQKDETIKGTQDKEKHPYWKIYFASQEKEAKVRIHVTAQNGTSRDYYLTLSLTDKTAPVLKKVSASRISEDKASVVYKTSERGMCYYQAGEAGAKIPTPDTKGAGEEVSAGTNTITLTGLTQGQKDLVIVVKDTAGNVSDRLVIRIPDIKKKGQTQRNNGNGTNVAQRPGYGGNKSEAVLPGGQNNGEGSLDKLKTVQAKEKSSGSKTQKDGEDTEQSGKKKLTVHEKPASKNNSTKNTGNSDKQSKTAKTDKTAKKAAAATASAPKGGGKGGTGDSSAAGGKQTGSATGTVGKISHTWKHMRLLTRTLLVFALAGILYLGFFAGARRHYKKQKLSDPMI